MELLDDVPCEKFLTFVWGISPAISDCFVNPSTAKFTQYDG